jgi:hypothetical protein
MDVNIEGTGQVEIIGMRASLQCRIRGHSWGGSLVGPNHNELPPVALRQCWNPGTELSVLAPFLWLR